MSGCRTLSKNSSALAFKAAAHDCVVSVIDVGGRVKQTEQTKHASTVLRPKLGAFVNGCKKVLLEKIPEVTSFVGCWLRNALHIKVQPDRLLFGIKMRSLCQRRVDAHHRQTRGKCGCLKPSVKSHCYSPYYLIKNRCQSIPSKALNP